ncbi:MAG: cation transporter [Erysipelotrichaceae bacterium]|nr:cation transporter [Erysipelotrichaceae bacterium]
MYKITLKLDGMACTMCESHVNDLIRNNLPVKKVKSSYKKNKAEVISEVKIGKNEFEQAFKDSGYRILNVTTAEEEKKRFSLFG